MPDDKKNNNKKRNFLQICWVVCNLRSSRSFSFEFCDCYESSLSWLFPELLFGKIIIKTCRFTGTDGGKLRWLKPFWRMAIFRSVTTEWTQCLAAKKVKRYKGCRNARNEWTIHNGFSLVSKPVWFPDSRVLLMLQNECILSTSLARRLRTVDFFVSHHTFFQLTDGRRPL